MPSIYFMNFNILENEHVSRSMKTNLDQNFN